MYAHLSYQSQAQMTEVQIKREFEKLHNFLRLEEMSRIGTMKEEERQKSAVIMKKIETINREISFVSEIIEAIQVELKQDDVSFVQVLQTFKKWDSLIH